MQLLTLAVICWLAGYVNGAGKENGDHSHVTDPPGKDSAVCTEVAHTSAHT